MEKNRTLGWTTIEESKRLVDAGLDPNTADMSYESDTQSPKAVSFVKMEKYDKALYASPLYNPMTKAYPCWSLGALKNIVEEELGKDFSYENGEWIIIAWTNTWGYKHYYFEEIVNCVIWILENGYIKKHE